MFVDILRMDKRIFGRHNATHFSMTASVLSVVTN